MSSGLPANDHQAMFRGRVISHSGETLPDELVFTSFPPQSIGDLLSAYSTDRIDRAPRPFLSRLIVAAIGGVAIGLGTLAILEFVKRFIHGELRWQFETSLCISAISCIAAMSVILSRRRRIVETFVGDSGIARRSRYEGQNACDATEEILLFSDSLELRWNITEFEVNAGYSGTGFMFEWLNSSGKELLCIRGSFHSETMDVPDHNSIHFATAAMAAWDRVQWNRSLKELQRDGAAHFRVFDSDSMSVGRGFLDCTFGGKTTRLKPKDVVRLTVDEGALHIECESMKWYRRSRICRIASFRISNFNQLLRMLDEEGQFTLTGS